jgi:hypothetical protein
MLGLVLAMASTTAQSGESSFSLSAGVEFTSGEYGGTEDIEDLYVPITGTIYLDNVAISLTVPYLSFRAPSGTTVTDPGGTPVPGSGQTIKESGLGDVVAGVTIFVASLLILSAESNLGRLTGTKAWAPASRIFCCVPTSTSSSIDLP